jgi:hypothetical protein
VVDSQRQYLSLLHRQHREQRGEGLREAGGISAPRQGAPDLSNKQLGAQKQVPREADVQGAKGVPQLGSKGDEDAAAAAAAAAAAQVLPTGKITITQQITACACDVATTTTWAQTKSASKAS